MTFASWLVLVGILGAILSTSSASDSFSLPFKILSVSSFTVFPVSSSLTLIFISFPSLPISLATNLPALLLTNQSQLSFIFPNTIPNTSPTFFITNIKPSKYFCNIGKTILAASFNMEKALSTTLLKTSDSW